MRPLSRGAALRVPRPFVCLLFVVAPQIAGAQADTTRSPLDSVRRAATLGAVTVIGSRSDIDEARDRLLATPGGVAMVQPAEIRGTRQANLHDVLRFTPGVQVQPRFGAADESQISVRGSGLRNNFHARGVNLLVNGMPYRNADGFTDFESIELLTTEAIEVHKGANALRYGGSTLGGAINLHTQTGYTSPRLTAVLQGGGHDFVKGQLATGGMSGHMDWYGSYARTQLGGYRDWSEQRRDRVNLHVGHHMFGADMRGFYFFARVAEQLPGALTAAEFEADPTAAAAQNVANRWGRDYDLHHAGFQLRAQLAPTHRLEVSPYFQYRDIEHPIFEVISQVSHDWGAELRYEGVTLPAGRENRLTIGVQPAYLTMGNQQYQNVQGERGAVTRDERDRASTIALYMEDALSLTSRLTAIAGFRAERSTRGVDDRFLSNGDQSDQRTYDAFTPRLGLLLRATDAVQLYANASRTVEPPLLLELSSFGNPGGFIDLRAQRAWQYEIGARRSARGFSFEVSLYDIELRDELLNQNVVPFPGASFTVPTYRNVPRSRHAGLEVGAALRRNVRLLSSRAGESLTQRVAYTYSRFTFVDDPQYGDNRLPGAPAHYVSAEVKYSHPSGISVAPALEWVPASYYVNSESTVENDAWASLGLRLEWLVPRAGAVLFLHAQNLTDERYSASVQVDNAAGRYFEPADPRTLHAGIRWTP